ncbi:MAG: tRNA (adenine(22)-N(1))-methyltransferase TrmK [Evtepia gabavorous]
MSAQEVLRQWLVTHGYCIQRETLVREGEKFYGILTATGGESPAYTLAELWAGPSETGEVSPHRLAYLEEQIRRRERALAGMAQGKTPPQGEMETERKRLEELRQMREEWSQWQQ